MHCRIGDIGVSSGDVVLSVKKPFLRDRRIGVTVRFCKPNIAAVKGYQ